eukprot:CAMPEP_0202725750 /NCGR_PEP_ID=MMETSP1385-20130828/184261_1 /ASSEMBLY_ACC=CAM_ASM_000861 /TAXON_ID=933848 /ORGANISM="Elphidium margaritaceum" /LENGTH=382 /DNA_ID=CAMNT_0049391955 /DNA_START=52 /DNA_END=1201 /DNA_ORIENTATION=+
MISNKGAKRAKSNDNEEDDEQYRDAENKWEGFHFTRLTCISILTLIIMLVALFLDNLSTFDKIRTCTFFECSQGLCNGCGGISGSDYEHYPTCQGKGFCGFRTGESSWIKPYPHSPNCPSCSATNTCLEDTNEFHQTPSDPYISQVEQWDSEYNYGKLCRNNDDDEACMAYDGGNTYLVFTFFAIIFNIFTLIIIAPLYCRDHSIFPCEICNDRTHIILGILFCLQWICNLIPIIVWLCLADWGMCDDADPNHNIAFNEPTQNFPGYSLGGLMICMIAAMVACGAVCCCWGDNRRYGDDRDTAKVDRQREKEMYRQKEMEMQPTQQQQQAPPSYDNYGAQPQQQQQPPQQYNNNYGGQPQQYGGQPQQYGGQPNNNMTYSYN